MTINIRPFNCDDAGELSSLITGNLLTVNITDYGEEAVKFLSGFYRPENIIEYADNDDIYVAVSGTKILGSVSLDESRIRNVFVLTGYQYRGIGRSLMTFIEGTAREKKRDHLFLYSNLSAVKFYKKMGYSYIEVIDEKLDGMTIKLALMAKHL